MKITALVVQDAAGKWTCLDVGPAPMAQKVKLKNLVLSKGENGKYVYGIVLGGHIKRARFHSEKPAKVIEPKTEVKREEKHSKKR